MKNILLTLALAACPVLAVDATVLNLVMPDAKMVTGIDIDRVKNSPFGQYMLGQIGLNEKEFAQLLDLAGLDPRRDLREVLVASTSVHGPQGSVVVVRGTFDESKLAALVATHGGSVSAWQGARILRGPSSGHSASFALLGGLLVAGEEPAVKAAIERNRAAKGPAPELAARIQSASGQYDAWVTTESPASLAAGVPPNPNMGNLAKADLIQGIENVTAGVRFGANVIVSGEAITRSDKDATALVDVVKFFVQMAQSSGNAPSGVAALIESIQLSAEGRTVKFSLSAPEQDFEKLMAPHKAARVKAVVHKR